MLDSLNYWPSPTATLRTAPGVCSWKAHKLKPHQPSPRSVSTRSKGKPFETRRYGFFLLFGWLYSCNCFFFQKLWFFCSTAVRREQRELWRSVVLGVGPIGFKQKNNVGHHSVDWVSIFGRGCLLLASNRSSSFLLALHDLNYTENTR
jgi:hypothetical protein